MRDLPISHLASFQSAFFTPGGGIHCMDMVYAGAISGGNFFATDGFCTHEQQHLAEGFVMDGVIECPLHMGQFDIETGGALAGPVCFNLATYEIRVENGKVYLKI